MPVAYFLDMIKRQAIVNAGVKFVFRNQAGRSFEETVFNYQDGITDHVKELAGEDALTPVQSWQAEKKVRDRADKPEYKCKINVALTFSNKISVAEYYHNSSWLEHGGAPEKAVRNAFVYQIDSYLKQTGKYNKNESKITFADVEDCLVIVISSFSSVTSYENQTKKAITNKGIQEAMVEMLRHQLEIYFIENPLDADKIAGQVLINKAQPRGCGKNQTEPEEEADQQHGYYQPGGQICGLPQQGRKSSGAFSLWRVIPLLAPASRPGIRISRRSFPYGGKILNCLKADYDKIFKNDIITDLIKVLGCGVQVKSKANKELASFDLNQLRWSKVILCTDADVDGFQIRTLLLTMIYRLTPALIEAGKVFIAESPLYEITSKTDTYFAYTEAEKQKFLDQLEAEGGRFTIQRSKGLGENEPDMMNLTTMNPQTRRLIKVMPTDMGKTVEMFDLLLGDNLSGRKDYIAENGHLYLDVADVS